jgi:AcrR family transcriptional regulator
MGRQTSKNARGETPRERIINAARKLFSSKGFHATTTAELGAEADVSAGQIYRHFAGKANIVVAIVDENARERVAEMHAIFDAVERGERTVFEAITTIAFISLQNVEGGLTFEILAEACRNPCVAERLATLSAFYRDGVRRLAAIVRPDVSAEELNAYAEIMMACFFGLGHSTVGVRTADIERMSSITACLMMRALGLPQEPVVRFSPYQVSQPGLVGRSANTMSF